MNAHAAGRRSGASGMDQGTILSKTAKAKEELETRKYKLDQRLRSVLITINGKLTAGQLAGQFSQMPDVHTLLETLLREGFVQQAIDPAAQLKQARAELAALISASLGPGGDNIAMKIEGAKTMEDLRAYLDSHRALLDGALGKTKAAAFWARVAALTA
jgi:hypothetical protein